MCSHNLKIHSPAVSVHQNELSLQAKGTACRLALAQQPSRMPCQTALADNCCNGGSFEGNEAVEESVAPSCMRPQHPFSISLHALTMIQWTRLGLQLLDSCLVQKGCTAQGATTLGECAAIALRLTKMQFCQLRPFCRRTSWCGVVWRGWAQHQA